MYVSFYNCERISTMKILSLLIGEYQWLCWIGFAVICVIVTCIILRNEEKVVEKPKKIRYSKTRKGVPV